MGLIRVRSVYRGQGAVGHRARYLSCVYCFLAGYGEISFHLLTNVFSHLQTCFTLCHFHLRDAGVFPQSPELLVAEEATSLLLRHSFVNSKLLVLQLNSHLLLLFFLLLFLKKKNGLELHQITKTILAGDQWSHYWS